MKKLIAMSMSSVLTFSSFTAKADWTEHAEKTVTLSQAIAKEDAQSLLNYDFSVALQEMLISAAKSGEKSEAFKLYAEEIGNLEKTVNSLVESANQQGSQISDEAMMKIWNEYRGAVRRRFAISFKAQHHLYDQSLFIASAENALDKFQGVCDSGRSEKGFRFDRPEIANLPPTSFEVSGQFQLGSNGGLTGFNGQSSSSAGGEAGRQTTGAILNGSAGIVSSIATSGGASQVVTACATAAPYLIGAAVAYAVVSYVMDEDKQKKLKNEIADAKIKILRDSASDQDVAKYYREACKEVRPLITDLQKNISLIKRSEQDRTSVYERALALKPSLDEYESGAGSHEKNMQYLFLTNRIKSGACKAQSEVDDKTVCYKAVSHFVLKSNEKIQIPINEQEAKTLLEPIEKSAKAFSDKYPKDKRAELISAKAVLILAPNWARTSQALTSFSFNQVDAQLSVALEKVQSLLLQMRTQKSALWNQSNPDLDDEVSAQKRFEELKSTHRSLVADGIKVIFDRKDRKSFQDQVQAHLEKARTFAKAYYKSKEVKSFITSVDALSRIYLTL